MYQDEYLLRSLGDAARVADPLLEAQRDALEHGQPSTAQLAALRDRAGRGDLPPDADEAFLPLSEEAQDRIAARVLESMAQESRFEEDSPTTRRLASITVDKPIKSRSLSRRRGLSTSSASAAAAAAVLVLLCVHERSSVAPDTVSLSGGGPRTPPSATSPQEGDVVHGPAGADSPGAAHDAVAPRPGEIARFGPDARIDLVLAPTETVRGQVAARTFLVRNGRAHAWSAPTAVTTGGVVRISGEAAKLFAGYPDGRWTLVVAVGRPDALPEAAAVARALAASEGDGATPAFQLLHREILLDLRSGARGP